MKYFAYLHCWPRHWTARTLQIIKSCTYYCKSTQEIGWWLTTDYDFISTLPRPARERDSG